MYMNPLTFLQQSCKILIYKGLYAIHSGELAGNFFVYIKEEDRGNGKALLLMPNPMEARYTDIKEIKFDLKFKNVKFVKKLPDDIYEVCKANFIYYAQKAGIYVSR